MKYTRMQREDTESFITIGEYVFETDPEAFRKLCKIYLGIGNLDIGRFANTSQRLIKLFTDFRVQVETISTRLIERLIQERPKPGRGGLLPGEGEEAL